MEFMMNVQNEKIKNEFKDMLSEVEGRKASTIDKYLRAIQFLEKELMFLFI